VITSLLFLKYKLSSPSLSPWSFDLLRNTHGESVERLNVSRDYEDTLMVCLRDLSTHPSPSTHSTHGGAQTEIIWILRSNDFLVRFFEWRGLRLHTWKLVLKFRDSLENVFDLYGDSRETLLEILTVVIILSQISAVCCMVCLWDVLRLDLRCSFLAPPSTARDEEHQQRTVSLYISVSLSFSLSLSHIHSLSHTHTHAHTHTLSQSLSLLTPPSPILSLSL